mmetsp:Transcript_39398/g.37871  ORF Transcript_39398/g.37871 Transcript_39398/m.37871 type:complete len:89 (+) Transcript_39398:1566-1832(+)
MLKEKRLFEAMKYFKLFKKGKRNQFQSISHINQKNLKQKFLDIWTQLFCSSSKVKLFQQRQMYEQKFKVLNALKHQYQKQKRSYFIMK